MNIKTDGRWKNFKDISEVPKKILSQFYYLDEDTVDGFLNYENDWYHTSDFMRLSKDQFPGWDGYSPCSYFSGVLIKLSSDGEQYMIGKYFI